MKLLLLTLIVCAIATANAGNICIFFAIVYCFALLIVIAFFKGAAK